MLVRNLVLIAAASAAAVLAAPIDMPPHVGSGDPGTNPTNTSVLPDTRNMTLQSILSNVQIALAYNISTFADALSQDADLLDDFTDVSGSTTIFVPTDEAVVEFSLTRPLEAGRLLNNAAALRRFLLYHAVRYGIIVPQTMPTGRYFYKTASGGEYVRAQVDHNTTDLVSGNFTQTTTTLGLGFGFEARIVATLPSLNGIVHVIDAVLMQPMSLTTTLEYLGLVGVAGLIEGTNLTRSFNALRNVTFFAPSNLAVSMFVATSIATGTPPLNPGVESAVVDLHLASGRRSSDSIAQLTLPGQAGSISSTGLPGETIDVAASPLGIIYLTGKGNPTRVPVTDSDIVFVGGIMHLIDGVLVPSNDTLAAVSGNTTITPKF